MALITASLLCLLGEALVADKGLFESPYNDSLVTSHDNQQEERDKNRGIQQHIYIPVTPSVDRTGRAWEYE